MDRQKSRVEHVIDLALSNPPPVETQPPKQYVRTYF